ncbi:uncharacterized protein LOC131552973 isoform X2 [Onychostoma macrolepis]|uniref:uncharacterized protein LOC131552973 isoform X2 n=1 Tax=Onychostoma macrolepis TaxID=369639 RepID=UPI00272C1011|nr:uncharacterized protein LOC131552973 isoform X2 [Onychostoma macrolepis]
MLRWTNGIDSQPQIECKLCFVRLIGITVATRSSLYPDQMVTEVTRIQSISRPDGGSAPRDDLYSPERQRRPGHLDEPQRQIPSEDLIT